MHQDKTTAKHCHVLTVIDGVSEEIIDVIEIGTLVIIVSHGSCGNGFSCVSDTQCVLNFL